MIKRIELKNFMSHEHTVIEPAAGLTVLLGANNVGKSAIIAALQILCYNENSTYVMRHGAKECSVKVETDDGHVIEWHRKKSPSYTIDGQKFDRLARSGVPEELHKALRLPKVEGTGNDEFDVHFGSQKTPIFLLDQSGATAARFFASSSDAIRLVSMQQRHKEKVRDAKKERSRLDAESKQLNAELAALQPVSEIERCVEKVEAEYLRLIDLQRHFGELERAEQILTQQNQIVATYAAKTDALSSLLPPPELTPTKSIEQLIAAGTAASLQSELASIRIEATQNLTLPPALSETAQLEKLVKNLAQSDLEAEDFGREKIILSDLTEPPHLSSPEAFELLIDQFKQTELELELWKKQSALLTEIKPIELGEVQPLTELLSSIQTELFEEQTLRRQIDCLEIIEAPTLPIDTETITDLIQKLTLSQQESKKQRSQVEKLAEELTALEKTLRQATLDKDCPVCGGPLDADRLLEQAERSVS